MEQPDIMQSPALTSGCRCMNTYQNSPVNVRPQLTIWDEPEGQHDPTSHERDGGTWNRDGYAAEVEFDLHCINAGFFPYSSPVQSSCVDRCVIIDGRVLRVQIKSTGRKNNSSRGWCSHLINNNERQKSFDGSKVDVLAIKIKTTGAWYFFSGPSVDGQTVACIPFGLKSNTFEQLGSFIAKVG